MAENGEKFNTGWLISSYLAEVGAFKDIETVSNTEKSDEVSLP